MRLSKILLNTILAITVTTSNAWAENWVSIGNNMYMDTQSKKRLGDIASIYIRYTDGAFKLEFDCKSRTIISDRIIVMQVGSPFDKAITYSCAKWYEVWK